MRPRKGNPPKRIVEYDALQHRLWILGQRCHHGATGSVVAVIACLGFVVERAPTTRPLVKRVALVATGGALMAHDWKDHSIWFQRGRGNQR